MKKCYPDSSGTKALAALIYFWGRRRMVETIWNHEVGTLVGVEPPRRKMEASNFRTRIVEWLPRVGSVGVLTHRCFLGRARRSVDFGGAGRPGWHDLRLGRRRRSAGHTAECLRGVARSVPAAGDRAATPRLAGPCGRRAALSPRGTRQPVRASELRDARPQRSGRGAGHRVPAIVLSHSDTGVFTPA